MTNERRKPHRSRLVMICCTRPMDERTFCDGVPSPLNTNVNRGRRVCWSSLWRCGRWVRAAGVTCWTLLAHPTHNLVPETTQPFANSRSITWSSPFSSPVWNSIWFTFPSRSISSSRFPSGHVLSSPVASGASLPTRDATRTMFSWPGWWSNGAFSSITVMLCDSRHRWMFHYLPLLILLRSSLFLSLRSLRGVLQATCVGSVVFSFSLLVRVIWRRRVWQKNIAWTS